MCTVERRLGAPEEVELCEGGHDVLVTSANREAFVVQKIVNQLVLPVVDQAAALARGLSDVIREGITLREFLLPLHSKVRGRHVADSELMVLSSTIRSHCQVEYF